jgi:proteasome lid subunit RPN8/RPN11
VSAARVVRLGAGVRRAIVGHARRARPFECCGFLIGTPAAIAFAVAMSNIARDRRRYRIDDRAHIELRRTLRDFRPALSIRGVYHSHPAGDAQPSATDLAGAHYPEWIHLIVGLRGARSDVRAFVIRDGRARRVALR